MKYIFYHIFKRLGWTNRKPILYIEVNEYVYATSEEKDDLEETFFSKYSDDYNVIIDFYGESNGIKIKTIY